MIFPTKASFYRLRTAAADAYTPEAAIAWLLAIVLIYAYYHRK